jgi:2-dehydro-3-deoxyglucarate aldolase/4-hydroxy-2-oxoheptanedioate aldolase
MSGQRTQTLVVVQIEREEAIRNLDGICAVDGVDVVCLGYMDLSVDMGLPGQMDHPHVVNAIQTLIDGASKRGVAAGIIHPDLAVVDQWVKRGMRFVSLPSETDFLRAGATQACASLRKIVDSHQLA